MVTFPTQDSCPRCASTAMEEAAARPTRRALGVDHAVVPAAAAVRGPTGADFVPFGVGYVELPGEVKVESRLTESDPERARQRMEMELVIVPFRTDDDGNEVVTFAFRPVA